MKLSIKKIKNKLKELKLFLSVVKDIILIISSIKSI